METSRLNQLFSHQRSKRLISCLLMHPEQDIGSPPEWQTSIRLHRFVNRMMKKLKEVVGLHRFFLIIHYKSNHIDLKLHRCEVFRKFITVTLIECEVFLFFFR
jgi:hypothetical protein